MVEDKLNILIGAAIVLLGLLKYVIAAPTSELQALLLASPEVGDIDPEYTAGYYQGDMNVTRVRNGLTDLSKRWPNNIVYFRVDTAFDRELHSHILYAMIRIERDSCIRFMAADWNTPNYVYISGRSAGCNSEIGYQGGVQLLNLQMQRPGTGCFKFGTILHELLHTLGFVHQQSTADRDEFVTIVEENIRDGQLVNFEKYAASELTSFGVPYDYYSVMHYNAYAFSKNGQKTIVAKGDSNIVLGQRVDMSPSDVLKLNRMYNCR